MSFRSARAVCGALAAKGYGSELLELDAELPKKLSAGDFDVAFPVCHGPLGEDGCLQGLLEVLNLPYVGSGVLASAAAAHKPTAKVLFARAGLPLAPGMLVEQGAELSSLANRILRELGGSLVFKPASGGSAIGVQRLTGDNSPERVAEALSAAFAISTSVLVERLVVGEEVTCGVLDTQAGSVALPPTLLRSVASDWYDFQARYASGGSLHECPAKLPEQLYAEVQRCAVGAHLAVGARDLSRVDFVVAPEGVVVLEVNTLPGMTATSNFPEAAAVSGFDFPSLCQHLVERAAARPLREVPVVQRVPD